MKATVMLLALCTHTTSPEEPLQDWMMPEEDGAGLGLSVKENGFIIQNLIHLYII